MIKGKIKEALKSKVGIAIITGFIALNVDGCTSSGSSNIDSKKLVEKDKEIAKLTEENKTLQGRVDAAKPWFEMNEQEKQAKEKELKKQQEAKAAEEKSKKEAEEKAKLEEEQKGYDTGVIYDQLARTSDKYKTKKVKFKGKVIQVMEGKDETQIRFAVNDDYNKVILCGMAKDITKDKRVLENDEITIMGMSLGLITYKSTLGGEITIPAVAITMIEQ